MALVHFELWPGVEATLAALDAQTRPPDALVVLDDGSRDGSLAELRRARPGLEVVASRENRGVVARFAAGTALLRARGHDAVLLLTHETRLEPDALERLVTRLEASPRTGAVGPLLGFGSAPGVVFSAGGELLPGTWQNPHAGMYEPEADWRGRGVRPAAWLDGACVLLRGAALDDVGPLPVRFWAYYDDVELGVRLRRAGWEVECVLDAVARQEPGGLSEHLRVRNRLGFLHACAPRRVLVRALVVHLRSAGADALRGGEGRALARAQLAGLRDFVLDRWGPVPGGAGGVSRRDAATGGALAGPAEPSWSLPAHDRRRQARGQGFGAGLRDTVRQSA